MKNFCIKYLHARNCTNQHPFWCFMYAITMTQALMIGVLIGVVLMGLGFWAADIWAAFAGSHHYINVLST